MDELNLDLTAIDIACVAAYFVFVIGVGLYMRRRAGADRDAYFLSKQNVHWLLVGTSMVATTFAINVPLMVAGWAREFGVAKNWEWWVFVVGQMFTTFFFARLWRRTRVYNDAQFIHQRYSGKPAMFLRGFRALYVGFIMNMIVMGGGLIASKMLGELIFGVSEGDPYYALYAYGPPLFAGVCALIYTTLSGYAAIVITDFVGFTLAMAGAIAVAVAVVMHPEVGGINGMISQLQATPAHETRFMPPINPEQAGMLPLYAVLAYLGVRWWAQIYGGAEPGGQVHIVQRLSSARNERHAVYGSLWYTVCHYAIRPLPWIIAGLGSILIFPVDQYTEHEKVYLATLNFLPVGLKGLTLASLFAALLTTFDTRMNLGASYFINDFYKPFIADNRSERHYMIASRLITVIIFLMSLSMFLIADNVRSLFFIYAGIGSGAGLVYILRFYWWRINAWSEISAMAAALLCMIVFRFWYYGSEEVFNANAFQYMFISLGIVSAIWIAVTLLTRPTDMNKLVSFYEQVRPAGPFWNRVREHLPDPSIRSPDNMKIALVGWLFSNPMTLGYLIGLGNLILGRVWYGLGLIGLGVVCTVPTLWAVKRFTDDEGASPPTPAGESATT